MTDERVPSRPDSFPVTPYHGETYHELPAVKASPWTWKVPTYIFVAGLAGSAQVIATLANLFGDREDRGVVRAGRTIAVLGAAAGAPLLIADLHTRQRWYNMLRIFRRTSPMSIGSYTLLAFGAFSGLTAAADLLAGRSRVAAATARVTQLPAAVAGAGLSTYTAALLAATSTPLWAAAPGTLAVRFGSSAVATGAAALSLVEHARGAPDGAADRLDAVAMVALGTELVASAVAERRYREAGVADALDETRWGHLDRIGALAVGAALPLACHAVNRALSRRSPALSVVASLAILAGGMMMRHAVLRAGDASAQRPRDYFRLTQPALEPWRGER